MVIINNLLPLIHKSMKLKVPFSIYCFRRIMTRKIVKCVTMYQCRMSWMQSISTCWSIWWSITKFVKLLAKFWTMSLEFLIAFLNVHTRGKQFLSRMCTNASNNTPFYTQVSLYMIWKAHTPRGPRPSSLTRF